MKESLNIMGVGVEGLRSRALKAVDTAVTFLNLLGEGTITTETYRHNRDGKTFAIDRHHRGGRKWGLLIYPDGIVVEANNGDVLYRHNFITGAIVDRVVVGNHPPSHLFIPQEDYDKYPDELRVVFQPPTMELTLPEGVMGAGGSFSIFSVVTLPEEAHRTLFAKVSSQNPR